MSFDDPLLPKPESLNANEAKNSENVSRSADPIDEKVLGQGEDKYHLLFDSINEGVAFLGIIYDNNGKATDFVFVDLNPAYESIFGIKKVDRIGRRVSEFFDQATYLETFSKVALTTEPSTFETYAAYLQKYLRISVCSIKKEVLITIFSDITELKMVDEALRESDAKRHSLFTNMLNGYAYCQMIFDEQGKPVDFSYLEINDAFEKLTGLGKEKVIGKKISEVLPEALGATPEVFETYGRVASTGKPERFEVFFKPLDRWFDISVFSPKKGFFISVFDNITERKQMQVQLEKYATNLERLVEERTKQLKEAERLAAIGQTAGIVAHDIRDPVQTIINELYLAKDALTNMPKTPDNEALQDSIKQIEKQTDYIVKVSWDLQDFARPLKPKIVEIELCEFIPSAVATLEIPENIRLGIKCDKQMPNPRLDKAFLKRIITNLATNAIQAMPQGGNLIIEAFRKDDKTVITIEDTGMGISDNIRSKLWSPLFTTEVKGQGFGLAVAKRLTEVLNGTITFESEIGKGTKFILEFPLPKPIVPS